MRGTRRPVWRAVLLGSVVTGVEIAQDFGWSRHGAPADVLAGTFGIKIRRCDRYHVAASCRGGFHRPVAAD